MQILKARHLRSPVDIRTDFPRVWTDRWSFVCLLLKWFINLRMVRMRIIKVMETFCAWSLFVKDLLLTENWLKWQGIDRNPISYIKCICDYQEVSSAQIWSNFIMQHVYFFICWFLFLGSIWKKQCCQAKRIPINSSERIPVLVGFHHAYLLQEVFRTNVGIQCTNPYSVIHTYLEKTWKHDFALGTSPYKHPLNFQHLCKPLSFANHRNSVGPSSWQLSTNPTAQPPWEGVIPEEWQGRVGETLGGCRGYRFP